MRIEIKEPWEMPELRDCAAIIAWMRNRLGRHPLSRRKIFPLALLEDSSRAIVEAEEGEEFYAVVDFCSAKAGRKAGKASVVMLADRAAVQELIDDTHADCRKRNQPDYKSPQRIARIEPAIPDGAIPPQPRSPSP